jgi:hypothetical protein
MGMFTASSDSSSDAVVGSAAQFAYGLPSPSGASEISQVTEAIATPREQAVQSAGLVSSLIGYFEASSGQTPANGSSQLLCLKTLLPQEFYRANDAQDIEKDCAVPLAFNGF